MKAVQKHGLAATGQDFMGIRAIVKVGIGTEHETEYAMDFDQELLGVAESQKSWQLSCRACREASGLRKPAWLSSIFYTGEGEYGEEEQRHTFQRALNECNEHVTLHQRMAAWYEMLHESPSYKRGVADEMLNGMARE
jgi:hypothetical protein